MELVGREATFLFLIFFAALIPFVFFLITQQNTLKAIQTQNRTMSPGEVWLQLIPSFGMIWMFVVVVRLSKSIANELASSTAFSFEENQNQYAKIETRPTQSIGLTYCILLWSRFIPLLGGLTSLAGIICWIVYWIKLAEYKSKIVSKNYHCSPPSGP